MYLSVIFNCSSNQLFLTNCFSFTNEDQVMKNKRCAKSNLDQAAHETEMEML